MSTEAGPNAVAFACQRDRRLVHGHSAGRINAMRFLLVLALSLSFVSAVEPQTDTGIFQESLVSQYPSVPASNPTRMAVTDIAARLAAEPDADQEFLILYLLGQAMSVTETTAVLPTSGDAAQLVLTNTARAAADQVADLACQLARSTLAQDHVQVGELNPRYMAASQSWQRWQPIIEMSANVPELLEAITQRLGNVPVAERPNYQLRLQAAQTQLAESIKALPQQTGAGVPFGIVAELRQIGLVRQAALEIELIADDLDVAAQLADRPAAAGLAPTLAARLTQAIAAKHDAKRAMLAYEIESGILEYRGEGLFDRQARREDEYYQLLDAWVNGETEAFDPAVEPTPADREADAVPALK